MKTRLISFFADIDNRSYYSDHAKRLGQACQAFAIPHDIRPLRSRGNYRRNCLHKPRFILDRLNEYHEPLLWLDVDSCIHKPLDIFDSFTGLDVVAASAYGTLGGMKASPLYFGDTDNAREFLQAWVEAAREVLASNLQVFDHEPLFEIFARFGRIMNIHFLGVEYCAWPGFSTDRTVITMGLADAESKKAALRELGLSEARIAWQSPGTAQK